MPMHSGISKAQPGTDGSPLCWIRTITQHISAWQPHSLSNKSTLSPCYNFAHAHRGSHVCTRSTRATKMHILSLKSDTDTMEILWKYTSTSFSLLLSTFLSLLCISSSTINSILRQPCVHAHTHWHRFRQSWMNSEWVYLLAKVKRNLACYKTDYKQCECIFVC